MVGIVASSVAHECRERVVWCVLLFYIWRYWCMFSSRLLLSISPSISDCFLCIYGWKFVLVWLRSAGPCITRFNCSLELQSSNLCRFLLGSLWCFPRIGCRWRDCSQNWGLRVCCWCDTVCPHQEVKMYLSDALEFRGFRSIWLAQEMTSGEWALDWCDIPTYSPSSPKVNISFVLICLNFVDACDWCRNVLGGNQILTCWWEDSDCVFVVKTLNWA